MIYTRKEDGSDVYVIRDAASGKYICRDCSVEAIGSDHAEDTPRGMIAHLIAHRDSGNSVPDAVITKLEEDGTSVIEVIDIGDRHTSSAKEPPLDPEILAWMSRKISN